MRIRSNKASETWGAGAVKLYIFALFLRGILVVEWSTASQCGFSVCEYQN
jgi:hypothetical protein